MFNYQISLYPVKFPIFRIACFLVFAMIYLLGVNCISQFLIDIWNLIFFLADSFHWHRVVIKKRILHECLCFIEFIERVEEK